MASNINETYGKALIYLEKLIEEAKEVLTDYNDENRYCHLIREIRNVVGHFKDHSDVTETISLIDQAFNLRLNDFKKYTGNHFNALLSLLHSEKDPQIIIIPTKSKMLELAGISNRHDKSLYRYSQ